MRDINDIFGDVTITCNAPNCTSEEIVEGFDGYSPQYSDVNEELREMGWTIKKENGEWIDLCPTHINQ